MTDLYKTQAAEFNYEIAQATEALERAIAIRADMAERNPKSQLLDGQVGTTLFNLFDGVSTLKTFTGIFERNPGVAALPRR